VSIGQREQQGPSRPIEEGLPTEVKLTTKAA
jgi:hypothetical protein